MKFRSLKFSLLAPFVLLIAVVATVLSTTYYLSSSHSIRHFSQQYIAEVAERIQMKIGERLGTSKSLLSAAYPKDIYGSNNIKPHLTALRQRLWGAALGSSNPNAFVYYGNDAGQSVTLERMDESTFDFRIQLEPDGQRTFFRYNGYDLIPTEVFANQPPLKVHERPWFNLVKEGEREIWTPPYQDLDTGTPVMTRSRPVFNRAGKFVGAVATDFFLADIDNFLSGLEIAEHGRAFIVNPDGVLLASSQAEVVHNSEELPEGLPLAAHTRDGLIRAIYTALKQEQDEFSELLERSKHDVYTATVKSSNGQDLLVAVSRITDDAGLDWLAVVAIPQKVILSDLQWQLYLALIVSLLSVLVTIVVGTLFFGRIANHIKALSNAVDRMSEGETNIDLNVTHKNELGKLAKAFKHMQGELFTDRLTGVASRLALLTRQEQLSKKKHNKFTLFFIDLNRFKPINDTYGHKNGDLVLKEIAQRLCKTVREQDMVGRFGGDEFVIIANGVCEQRVIDRMLHKFNEVIERPLENLEDVPAEITISVGASIGYAMWPTEANNLEDLSNLADERMYQDKPKGER